MTSYVRVSDTIFGQSPYWEQTLLKVADHCSAFFWYLITHQRFCKPVCHFVSLMLTLLTHGLPLPAPLQSTTVTWVVWFCVSSSKCLIGYARLCCQASQLSAGTCVLFGVCALDPEAKLILLSVSRVRLNTVIVLS